VRFEYGRALVSGFWLVSDPDARLACCEQAVRPLVEVVAEQPGRIYWRYTLCHVYNLAAEEQLAKQNFDKALALGVPQHELLASLSADDQQRESVRRLRAMCENGLGCARLQCHRIRPDPAMLAEAERNVLTALQLRRRLFDEDPDTPASRVQLAVTMQNYGNWWAAQRRPSDAIKVFDESRALLEEWGRSNAGNIPHEMAVASCYLYLGREHRNLGNHEAAFEWLSRSCQGHLVLPTPRLRELANELNTCQPLLQCPKRQQCIELQQRCRDELRLRETKKS
jgi:hypothetical protein